MSQLPVVLLVCFRSLVLSHLQGRTGPPGYREISRWAPKQRVPNKINDQCRLCTRKNRGMIIIDVNSSLSWDDYAYLLTYLCIGVPDRRAGGSRPPWIWETSKIRADEMGYSGIQGTEFF